MNRELGWLEFNQRVLEQAEDETTPLLERAKFLAITGSNLDEFIMVRIGGLKMQFERNSMQCDPTGLTVAEQLQAVLERCHILVAKQYSLFREVLEPTLAKNGIHRVNLEACSEEAARAAENRFESDVLPVLSPQALHDRPFPQLAGLGMHLCIRLRAPKDDNSNDEEFQYAVIPLGRTIQRVIPLPSSTGHAYVLLEDLVAHYIDQFLPGREVVECVPFRITRNADIEIREDGAGDLMGGMEEVLESRRLSRAVRLEVSAQASDPTLGYLIETLELGSQDTFRIDGPIDLTYLFAIHGIKGFEMLRDPKWPPLGSPQIDPTESMFTTISERDQLLIHPYERFDPIVRLIEEAATDPDVLAIKQVLYRTSRKSPIVAALEKAAKYGKYVTAIVELKARFDEARNIEWAREMEQAGVQVIYGVRGLKTHAKLCIIVRREPEGVVRYMHFGTGNYNEATAELYGDISLLTRDETLGADATSFFNGVTGASQPSQLRKIAAAPTTLRKRLLALIEAETQRCREGQKAEIIVKLNALVDTEMIDALYRASRAGVKIKLNIRGVCCLRPGIEGLSETIQVISIVDRYLEHARIIYFRHGGDHELFISSADWMPRNLDRRVELLLPVEDPECKKKLRNSLQVYFRENVNAWHMDSDGSYRRPKRKKGQRPIRSQQVLYQQADAALKAGTQLNRGTFELHQRSTEK